VTFLEERARRVVGKWDQGLFLAFRAAKGERRRRLLGEMIRVNEPLIKILVDQLCGRGENKRPGRRSFMGGTLGFREIPWEDAYQAGLMAFCKAAEQYDPSKGKISWYLKSKIRHELQVFVTYSLRLARVPRGQEDKIIPMALVGDQAVLEGLSHGEDDTAIVDIGIGPDDLRSWDTSGQWPESLEAWQHRDDLPPEPEPPERSVLDLFLEKEIVFCSQGRVACSALFGCWERFVWQAGGFCSDEQLRSALRARGVRPVALRVCWSKRPVGGFGGLKLRYRRDDERARLSEASGNERRLCS
jgi:hypothetical protein